jgi:uncharacterized RDD family membrane protein YckC
MRISSKLLADPGTPIVFYARSDLAGLSARLAIGAIDLSVLTFLIVITALPLAILGVEAALKVLVIPIAWAYMAALKRTRVGTLGYRMMGFRLVGLDGRPVSLFHATARFVVLLWLAGVDTFSMVSDENAQTFRDKFAQTYVVRRNAEPAGVARVSYNHYFGFGGSIALADIYRVAETGDERRRPSTTAS